MVNASTWRRIQDKVAVWIHITAIAAICIFDAIYGRSFFFFATAPGALLCAVELITVVFHRLYCVGVQWPFHFPGHYGAGSTQPLWMWRFLWKTGTTVNIHGTQNWLKWVEYSLSATCGSLATMLAHNTVNVSYIIAVLIAGVLQQRIGWIIDRRMQQPGTINAQWWLWLVAWMCQTFEFVIIYTHLTEDNRSAPAVFWVYVPMWSLFGLWATLDLLCRPLSDNTLTVDFIEAGYATLSWAAKVSVLLTIYAERT